MYYSDKYLKLYFIIHVTMETDIDVTFLQFRFILLKVLVICKNENYVKYTKLHI